MSAGLVCYSATYFLKLVLKIDDSLDVFPVHGVGGILGTFLAGIFASQQLGVFSGHGFADGIDSMGQQVAVQLTGIVSVFVYTGLVTFVLLKLIDVCIGLRVTTDEETEGLDVVLHNESGYDL